MSGTDCDFQEGQSSPEPISPELDDLTCALIDYALGELAESGRLSVSLAAVDGQGQSTLLSFDDEDFEESIVEAQSQVRASVSGSKRLDGLAGPAVRYAIAYDGAIDEGGQEGYVPALIVEYGEHGLTQGYSAYLTYENPGDAQNFVCSDVAPAGVVELLV